MADKITVGGFNLQAIALIVTLIAASTTSSLWIQEKIHSKEKLQALQTFFTTHTYQTNTNTTRINNHEDHILDFRDIAATIPALDYRVAQNEKHIGEVDEDLDDHIRDHARE